MSIGGLAWEWKTDAGLFTLIGIANRKPAVLLDLGEMSAKHTATLMEKHYEQCLDGLDDICDVWCKPYPEGSVALGDGKETWWPKLLPVQPTHKVVGSTSFCVLPVDQDGKPCELGDDCNLVTRDEWVEGAPPRYSLKGKLLHCDGVLLDGKWKIEPCMKLVRD